MSGVIKSENVAGLSSVRPLGVPSAAVIALARQDDERERLRRAVAALQGELDQRDAAMEALRRDVERSFADGRAEGRREGLAEAQDRQAERLAVLEKAAGEAQAALSRDLAALERLAALLARDCVDKILGEAHGCAGLVADVVAAQVARIDKAMLLGIEVSAADFADAAARAALAALAARFGVAVTADTALASGGCVMVLRLGRMTVGIDQQWGALRDVLGGLAAPPAAPRVSP